MNFLLLQYNKAGDIMKKIISLVFILFLVGCSKEDYITCNVEVDNNIQNYNMEGTYKIYYKDNYVTKIEKKENYISPDESVIDYFAEAKNLEYYNLNDLYGGYTYTIKRNKKSINLDADIDMSLVDVKEMVKDKYLDNDYVISNKLTLSGAKYFYKSKGAICD